jgi:hypothetical protein
MGEGAVLCRIDPASNQIVTTLALPGETLGPMVVSDKAVWIAHLMVPEGGEFTVSFDADARAGPGFLGCGRAQGRRGRL